VGGWAEARGFSLPCVYAGSLSVGLRSVASDQPVEKGERDLIRLVVRGCAHDRLTQHLGQPTLFRSGKGGKRVKRNQIGH
jgi:hypothetical protein